jgi:outer membrane murein-binding lipoprotein Lpp
MKRFSMLVGVAVVAAAMYVAAAPGSQQASGPTAKQFSALKKQVASLSKTVKTLKASEKSAKSEADAAVSFIGGCLVSMNAGALGVIQRGTPPGDGYDFGTGTGDVRTTALDVDASATPHTFLQAVDPTCITAGSLKGLTHASTSRLRLHAEHMR